MKKLTIVRFKPKPECYEEFITALKQQGASAGHVEHYITCCDDEVIAVAIRDADKLEQSAKQGVSWLDQQRHLLQEYNDIDRHTMATTGDLVEN